MTKRITAVLLTVCLLLNVFLPTVFAKEPEQTLSLNDAIELALERNRDLKIQKLNIDKSEEQLEDLQEQIKYYYDIEELPVGTYIPGVSSVYAGYLSQREADRIAKKQYEAMKQQMVVDVKQAYYDVLKNNRALELAKKAAKIAEREYSIAKVKNSIGMMSQAELLGYKTKVANAQSEIVSLQKTLKESQTKLLDLIGLNGEFKYQLVDDVNYQKADFISLDSVIAKALSQRYEIWGAERLAEVAKRSAEYLDNYNVGLIEADIKDLEAGNAKDAMKKQVETLYLALNHMEELYNTLEESLRLAEEKLRVTELQKEVGLATELQLKQAQQEYDSAVDALKNLIYQHDVTKTQLEVLTGDDLVAQYTEKK